MMAMTTILLAALATPKIMVMLQNVAPFFAILAFWALVMMLRRRS
jgi:hypothetical protein